MLIAHALLALALACRPGEVPRTRPSPRVPSDAAPIVRVGVVVDGASVSVTAPTSFELRAQDASGETRTAAAGQTWSVRLARDGIEATASGAQALRSSGPILVEPGAGGFIEIDGKPYRGVAVLRAGSDGVTAVNVVDLEDYLLGVVPREIGARPAQDLEAVKAQAVAARTYAIGNLGGREALGFDYFASVQDQVYGGVRDEDPVATRAVRETRGEIVTYHGSPILAYYSSTCGGRTAAIEESWPWRAPLPYLRSVSDRIPGTDDYYCSISNRFRWSTTWTREQLLAALGESLRAHTRWSGLRVRRFDGAEILDRGESGRVTLKLTVDSIDYTLRADSVRWVLRTPAGGGLNSSHIERIELPREGGNGASALTVHGRGWGHGIGMCQMGALGRARAGQSYREILRTYYRDTDITRLY